MTLMTHLGARDATCWSSSSFKALTQAVAKLQELGGGAWKGIVLEKESCALIYQEISNTLHIHDVSSLSFEAEVEDKALSKRKILKGT